MRDDAVGILQTGVPPAGLEDQHGTYSDMVAALLGPGFRTQTYDVQAGALPAKADAHPAYVITGSAAGAYEDLPWIAALTAFLLAARGRAKLVGLCFGHQIMAQTFGGTVMKSDKGWGLGLQDYRLATAEPWMDAVESIAVPVSHQDQVIALPPSARAVGGNSFNPNGVLVYDDQPAISFQCHPEFSSAYAVALVELRRDRLPEPAAADGFVASLARPNDCARLATWIRRFLTS